VDQSSEESLDMHADDPVLPVRELDRSRVLRAWPMLREEARPVLPVAVDVDRSGVTPRIEAAASSGQDRTDRRGAVGDDSRVCGVEGDPESPYASPVL
jgi:hypothetical protein